MKKVIRVGIITYWWSKENYGQILQMYALQKYLRDNGYDAFLIKYDPRKDATNKTTKNKTLYIIKIFNIKKVIRFFKRKYSKKRKKEEEITHPRQFDNFFKTNIKQTKRLYISIKELRDDIPEADIYMTGSDIVWSKPRPAFYLNFGRPETKRISYAASFGREDIPESECKQIEHFLKKFDLITVRESQGIEICKKAGINNAKLVLDPTFLLSKEHYIELSGEKSQKKQFCFLYLLGSETKLSIKKIQEACKSRNLEVIYATCERYDKYPKVYPTINEWLGYYAKADIIVTNSYHGCIFAIIFNKNFIFLPLKGIHTKLNVRVTSLLSLLRLSDRICENNLIELFNTPINYFNANKRLETIKKNNISLLESVLQS